MSDSPMRDGLKIKTAGSIAGGACCPHCGGLLPASSVHQCPHCQADLRVTGREAPPQARSSGPGVFAALGILLGTLVRFSLLLVLVALLAVGGTLAYNRWWPSLNGLAPGSIMPATACASCQGKGQVRCTTCGGGGKVEGELIHTPCEQCGGTGSDQHKMKKGVVKCPFCRGTGIKESHRSVVVCGTCGGRGVAACAACGGTGKQNPDAGKTP